MPPETPSMFLNFIRIFNDPQPNIDTLKESECQKALGILRQNSKAFRNRKNKTLLLPFMNMSLFPL